MSRKKLRLERKQRKLHHDQRGGYNEHHPYCSWRGNKGDFGEFREILDYLKLPEPVYKHDCWHYLFENLLAEEVIRLLKKASQEGKRTVPEIILFIRQNRQLNRSKDSVNGKDLAAWEGLFGTELDLRQVRQVIRRDWMYPGIYASVSDEGRVVRLTIILPKFISKIGFKNIRVDSYKNGRILRLEPR